jgi:hypothetical protein
VICINFPLFGFIVWNGAIAFHTYFTDIEDI